MSRNFARTVALLAGCWLGAQSATAVRAQSWIGPVVAEFADEESGCALQVLGNGRFYKIVAAGLEPGEAAGLFITNEDMRPVDRTIRADASGSWAEFYVPFLARYEGGTVRVTVASAACDLQVAFPWSRPGASIDDRTQATLSMPRSLSLR